MTRGRRLAEWFAARPRPVRMAVTLGLVALVGAADYWTGEELSVVFLYLAPVAVGAWHFGRRIGALVALVSALTSSAVDLSLRRQLSHPAVHLWNLLAMAVTLLIFALLFADLSRRFALERALARRDPLTGIANRRALVEALASALERARRAGEGMTVAYIDVDDFKTVNDRHGHAAGDAVLAAVAATLLESVRHTDFAGRLGGDEFGLLLPGAAPAEARAALERLRDRLGRAVAATGYDATLSIGAVSFVAPPDDVATLLAAADRLMYEVKSAGKDSLRHEVVSAVVTAG